ncbi:hypothetical protein [Desulfovibrio litoralis]|uniref:Uncharacterized protein n=1 Tax=Desulfovibrio litoralis DSM 11393 TaxID=1121455 RepID=A0A1M7SLY6_9BACT|nr:hypothetical protein [Desulfovibrio litoralis]SHN59499.1 hypothetical protein SAMN02745728_01019 [Desulfovibrio litoralis DSM 11393]
MNSPLKSLLLKASEEIFKLEDDAKKLLTKPDYNKEEYKELMVKKAKCLLTLPNEYEKLIKEKPELSDDIIEDKLRTFSNGANNALQLGSLFYMSALLYPDDHKPGEPNNLEKLILSIK